MSKVNTLAQEQQLLEMIALDERYQTRTLAEATDDLRELNKNLKALSEALENIINAL